MMDTLNLRLLMMVLQPVASTVETLGACPVGMLLEVLGLSSVICELELL